MDDNELSELQNWMDSIVERIESLEKKIDALSPESIISILESIQSKLELYEKNSIKLDVMVKELKGVVTLSRSVLNERRDMTPRWYKIGDVETPKDGEIWVKDIDGTETIAICKGCALIYPASSSLKIPEFWKPV